MRLLRDGDEIAEGTYTEILGLFHKLHGYSLDYGLKYEGYTLEESEMSA